MRRIIIYPVKSTGPEPTYKAATQRGFWLFWRTRPIAGAHGTLDEVQLHIARMLTAAKAKQGYKVSRQERRAKGRAWAKIAF